MIRAVVGVLRSAPVTSVYVAGVATVAGVMWWRGSEATERLARSSSTDLVHLRSAPELVLPASAFVLEHPSQVAVLPVLALSMGLLERWRGSLAAACTFVLGHVGATLAVATGLTVGISAGWIDTGHRSAVDVGVSYGAWAVAGALAARVPAPFRLVYVAVWTALLLGLLVDEHRFNDVGHVLGWGIGLAIAVVLLRKPRPAPRDGPVPPATPAPAR